jgi:hypothetical protein
MPISGFASRSGNALIPQRHGEETFDHRVYLLRHLELAEVAGAHGLAVHQLRYQLGEADHIRALLRLVCGDVEGWYRATFRYRSGIVVAEVLHGRDHYVLRGRRHILQNALLALLIVSRDEQGVRHELA